LFVKFEEVSSNIKSEQTNKQTNKMKIDNAAARKLINNEADLQQQPTNERTNSGKQKEKL
jgi:hypothetical protein